MLDVSKKVKTLRTATAKATLILKAETIELIRQNKISKGYFLLLAGVLLFAAFRLI